MRRSFQVPGLPDLRRAGLSHGVETDQLVFVASMAYHESEMRRADEAVTIADETRICLDRMQLKLQAVGCDLSHVCKMTVYLSDRNYQAEFAATYKEYWPDGDYPMRSTHFVGLARDCRVELDAIAVKQK
jgi:2-iminobutanoate/2-iminopropanoate deaminase